MPMTTIRYKMQLFKVTNTQFLGNGSVRCYVIAQDDLTAKLRATISFATAAAEKVSWTESQKKEYCALENLDIELMCENTALPWVSEVTDD